MGWLTEAELTMVVTSSEGRDNLPTQKPRGVGLSGEIWHRLGNPTHKKQNTAPYFGRRTEQMTENMEANME